MHFSILSKFNLLFFSILFDTPPDFTPAYTIHSELLRDRITLAVARALPILEWAPAKGQRAEVVKEKTQLANQNLGINTQIEQDDVLPSAAVPNLDAAESRLHHKKAKPQVA